MTGSLGRSLFASGDALGSREVHERWDESYTGGRTTILVALIALSTFVTIGALSFRQVTDPPTASLLTQAGIASSVDIDRYLDDQAEALEAWAKLPESIATDLPGFPVAIIVTAEEVRGDRDALRSAVLSRAAANVYAEGLSSFDSTGEQSLDLFSSETFVRLLVDRVNHGNHRAAGWIALLGAAVLVGASALYAGATAGERRIRSLGGALVVGTVPGIVVAGGAWALSGQYGADGDPYATEIRHLLQTGFSIPFRNYVICMGAGVAVVATGVILEIAARFWPSPGDVDGRQSPVG